MTRQFFLITVLSAIGFQTLNAQQIVRSLETELPVLLNESDLIAEGRIIKYQSKYAQDGRIFTLFELDIKHIVFKREKMRVKKHITLFDWGGQIDNDNQIYEHSRTFPYNRDAVFFLKTMGPDVNGIPPLCFDMTSPFVPCLRYDASDPFDNRPYYLWGNGEVWFRTYPEFVNAVKRTTSDQDIKFKERKYPQ